MRVGGQCRDLTVAEVQRGRPFVSARGCTPKGGPVNARRPHSQRGRGEGLGPGPRPPPLPGTFLAFLGRLLHGPGRAGRSGASHSPSRARPTAWNLGGGASLGPAPGAPGAPRRPQAARSPQHLRGPSKVELECDSPGGRRQACGDQHSARLPGGRTHSCKHSGEGSWRKLSAGTAARDGTSRRRYSHGSDCAGSARCVSF